MPAVSGNTARHRNYSTCAAVVGIGAAGVMWLTGASLIENLQYSAPTINIEPLVGYQHPLSLYDELVMVSAA